VANIFNQLFIQWRDINGRECTSVWTTQDQSDTGVGAYAALKDAAEACSNCTVIGLQFQTTIAYSNDPSTGPYPSVYDRAVLMDRIDVTGKPSRLELPGPRPELFQADLVTVDLSAPLIVALQAEVVAVIGDQNGNAVLPFIRGYRNKARANP